MRLSLAELPPAKVGAQNADIYLKGCGNTVTVLANLKFACFAVY
jgi:hypothetical protein